MALNVGDAVLTFFGDTSQLDQVFARLPAQTEAAMGAATASVGGLGEAVGGVNFELDATAQNVPYCGEVIKEAMDKGKGSVREAQGEAMLLGDAFGIHLPRHVTRFIAELPGVGTALQAAFAATAVLFIIDALIQGIEKIEEFAKAGERVREAMEAWDESQRKTFNNLSDGVLHAQERLAELNGNHLEALRLRLQAIDNQTLDKLDDALKKLGTDADKVFSELKRNWFLQEFFDLPGSDEAQTKLKSLQKTVSEALQTRTPEAYGEALKTLQGEFDTTTTRLQKLDDQLNQHDKDLKTALGPRAKITEAPDPNEIKSWEQLGKTIRGYISDVQEAKKEAEISQKAEGKSAGLKQAEDEVAQQKSLLSQRLADIELERDKARAAFAAKKIDATAWAEAEKKAVTDTAQAHKEYGQTVVDIYKKAGDATKAHAAAQAAELQQTKNADQIVKDLAKSTTDLDAANKEFATTSAKIWKDTQKEIAQVTDDVKQMQERDPFLPWQRDILRLNADLKNLGIQGFVPMQQHLDAAMKAEKALNDQGIHGGKLWLEVQAAKLKAMIALEQAEGKDAKAEIKSLRDVEFELRKFQKTEKDTRVTSHEVMQQMREDVGQFSLDIGNAFAAMATGQLGAAQAIEQAMGKLIQSIADHWAKYFAAMGIADIWFNPAKAAAEFAAAAALEAIGGIAGSLGGSGGGGGRASAGGNNAAIGGGQANRPAPAPTSGANVPRLFSGALVTQPTFAMVGDSASGGRGTEGIFNLEDPRSIQIMRRLVGDQGGGIVNNFHVRGMLSTQDLAKTARVITRGAQTGRLRVSVSNSGKVTRRS